MPIDGRKPKECFDTFANHIRPVVTSILGTGAFVAFEDSKSGPDYRDMHLVGDGGKEWVRVKSRSYGDVYLTLAQSLVAAKPKGSKQYELKTEGYWYELYERDPESEAQAIFRWENDLEPGKTYCKYHFHMGKVFGDGKQVPIQLDRNGVKTSLTELHIPTGYVLIEYVLRFLVADLGVAPTCGEGWEDILRKSETRFFEEFSPKGDKSGPP